MRAHTNADNRFPELPGEDESKLAYRLDQTYWGYIIREGQKTEQRMGFGQMLSGFLGFGCVSAAVLVWVLPGGMVAGDIALFKAVVSFISCLLGILFLWYSGEGSSFELQVDLLNREFREAMRSAKSHARIRAKYEFSEVSRLIVHPDHDDPVMASLMFKLKDQEALVEVARAPEHQLYVLRKRLMQEIANPVPQSRPVKRRGSQAAPLREADSRGRVGRNQATQH